MPLYDRIPSTTVGVKLPVHQLVAAIKEVVQWPLKST